MLAIVAIIGGSCGFVEIFSGLLKGSSLFSELSRCQAVGFLECTHEMALIEHSNSRGNFLDTEPGRFKELARSLHPYVLKILPDRHPHLRFETVAQMRSR